MSLLRKISKVLLTCLLLYFLFSSLGFIHLVVGNCEEESCSICIVTISCVTLLHILSLAVVSKKNKEQKAIFKKESILNVIYDLLKNTPVSKKDILNC